MPRLRRIRSDFSLASQATAFRQTNREIGKQQHSSREICPYPPIVSAGGGGGAE